MDIQNAIETTEKRLLIKRYSPATIRTYKSLLSRFFNYYKDLDINTINREDIQLYLLHLIDSGYSESMQNQAVNAIKFFYEQVLGHPKTIYKAERPKREKKLPTVLSPDEVRSIFDQVENIKHKTILMGYLDLAYREISPFLDRVIKNDGFYEWYSVIDHQPHGSNTFLGAAGALGKAIKLMKKEALDIVQQ